MAEAEEEEVCQLPVRTASLPERPSSFIIAKSAVVTRDTAMNVGNLVLPYYSIVHLYSILNLPYTIGLL